jgi:gluconolactonase
MYQRTVRRIRSGILLTTVAVIAQIAFSQASQGLNELVEKGDPERIATGFSFTEGPVWHPAGYLLFTDIPGNVIYKWRPNGVVSKFRSPSGYANGLTFDRQGRLIACEHSNRRVTRTGQDGSIVALADKYEGKKLNSPNDVVVKSDGSIYFTDPPYGLTSEYGILGEEELGFRGLYRSLPDRKTPDLLVADILAPNGLAFSPDEKVLYVDDSELGIVYAFDVARNGSLTNRRTLANTYSGADGMKVDTKGNLYVATGVFELRVYDSKGKHLGSIAMPETTRNCAFGGAENRTLFVTAGRSVYRIQMKVRGAPVVQLNKGN